MLSLVLFFTILPSYASCEGNGISVHCGKTPTSTFDKQGQVWTAFVHGAFVYVSHAPGFNQPYSAPRQVNQQPQKIYSNGENRPKIQVTENGTIFVSWTEKTAGLFTGDIRFSRSTNNGKSFQAVKTINDDGLLIGHRFDTMTLTPSGRIYIAWLDKRDRTIAEENDKSYEGISLYYAISSDDGATFSKNKQLAEHTCECCRIAIANSGHSDVTVMWRHIFPEHTRDHAITTITPAGHGDIYRATVDNWQTDACPHHGPDIDASNKNFTHLTWFSNGSRHKGIYYGTFQNSSKETTNVFEVDASPQASHPQVAEFNDVVWILWKSVEENSVVINARQSVNNGKHWSDPTVIASTSGQSDHPLVIKSLDALVLSWHTNNEGLRHIILDQKENL